MEFVNDSMGRSLRPRAEVQDRDQFGERVERHPQPEPLRAISQAGAQFIKLEMGQGEMMKPALVQARAVRASSGEPGGDRRMAMTEDAFRCRDAEPFRHGRQDFAHTLYRRFEPIEGRMATGGEGGSARLAAQGLDALVLAVRAVTDQCMDLPGGDPIV